ILEGYEIFIDDKRNIYEDWIEKCNIHLPSYACVVSLKCSPKRARELASWYIYIALSLLRIYQIKTNTYYGFFAYVGDLDPHVLQPRTALKPSLLIYDNRVD